MRFAGTVFSVLFVLAGVTQADAAPQRKLKLPESFAALVHSQNRGDFTVTQPLLFSGSRAGAVASLPAMAAPSTVATVLKQGVPQGYTPIAETKEPGFNFTGMTRFVPDVNRSVSAAADTAGLMSWTGKFN